MIDQKTLEYIVAHPKSAVQEDVPEMAKELLAARKVVEAVKAWPQKYAMTIQEWMDWCKGASDAMEAYNAAVGEGK
jgi:hypothetical protein